ncbi:MAG: M28 family peptidase, partial [Cytophagales bacterium]|nr:M28 family peptidase [Cytophagales bacterium]
RLVINGLTLKPGVDFVPDPACPSVHGNFRFVRLATHELRQQEALARQMKKHPGAVFLADFGAISEKPQLFIHLFELTAAELEPRHRPSALLLADDKKLTWGVAQTQRSMPLIYLHRAASAAGQRGKVVLEVNAVFVPDYESFNLAYLLPGFAQPDSFLVLSAHYDHLGGLGDVYFPGANDNASGVALLLDLASHFSAPQNRLPYSLLFLGFAAEEAGLIGSRHWVQNPPLPLERIKFLINLDMAGSGDDGLMVVNGLVHDEAFQRLLLSQDTKRRLTAIKARGEACNSDHCLFHRQGVPSFFIYTLGGLTAYHDLDDRPDVLTWKGYEAYFLLLVNFLKGF